MKKGKTFYLWLIIIIFIILWIPYFENISSVGNILFFGQARTFIGLYPWLLMLGLVEGFLITIYIQSIINSIKKSEPEKFDL